MGENSRIAWTDATFNPWKGCSKVSTGCEHCYAEHEADRRYHQVKWGPQGTRVKTTESYWKQPLKWNAQAAESGNRPRVFCASWADVFEDWTNMIFDSKGSILFNCDECGEIWAKGAGPDRCKCHCRNHAIAKMRHIRRDLFCLIDATPNLDWLLLTKRPENILRMWTLPQNGIDPGSPQYLLRQNVWLGTSVEDQQRADERIPLLLKCRDLAPVLFLSAEPLLGPIDFRGLDGIDQVIFGGESTQGLAQARPCNLSWIRDGIGQCRAAGAAAFVKQLGDLPHGPEYDVADWPVALIDSNFGDLQPVLSVKAGADPDEWPEELRVREFPKVTVT